MTLKEDKPQKESQMGLLNLGDSIKEATQVLNESLKSNTSRSSNPPSSNKPQTNSSKPQPIVLNLGDSIKEVTNALHQSISNSSRDKIQQQEQPQQQHPSQSKSISSTEKSENLPPPDQKKLTLNLGDSLKEVTEKINHSIRKSAQTQEEEKKTTLNLGDSLKDISTDIHESISKSSIEKEANKEKLNLGNPLQDATISIHEGIRSQSSADMTKELKTENSNENGNNQITNFLQKAIETINDSIQNKENQTGTGTESVSKDENNEEKGKLEQYIEDNILITMLNTPQEKMTAETQTDITLENAKEEEEEEETQEDQNDEIPQITFTRYSQEELQEALQKQLKTHELPPYEMREAVVDFARKQAIYKLMEEDYDKASKIDEAVAANLQSLRDDHHNIESDMLNSHLKQRLSDAEKSKSNLQDEWKRRIRSFKENEENELQKINERHEQERRLFENHWSQAAILMPFSKPSSSLLQLRSMQKAFALSHDFANARALKISAERKQKEESIEASKKASRSMRKEYLTLIKRQQNEILCFNENSSRKLSKLEAQRDSELKINENVRSQLASRVNKSRNIKKPMVLIPSPPKVDNRTTSLAALTGTMTQRTRSQFANYRQTVDMKMLDVKIDDMHAIMKPLTPATQIGKKSKNQNKSKR